MTTVTLPVLILAILLALATGWILGHRTARIRYIPIGATPHQDATAIALNDACCETWWTSCGTHHDTTCPTQHRSTT